MWSLFLVLCVVVLINCDEREWKKVNTRQGPVRGYKDPAGVYVFSNIPYATVPKGDFKFRAPLPPPAWLQPLEVPEKGIICPQDIGNLIDPQSKIMQEECLIANVYVPITNENNLPVVVYIHGGAFQIGFGDRMTPKNFAKNKTVIVVTFNYRLGVHGFLCLGTDSVPGNAGLKDQVALLRWVKKYIRDYGGNPDDVTLAGYSAGSISADVLMLAKSTKGLFNKVILESGASMASVSVQLNPIENAKEYARKLNFTDVDDVYALEEFYTKSSLDSLIGNTFFDRKDSSVLFGPCVEDKRKSALLYDSPENIIMRGEYTKVPVLFGISNMEGLIRLPKFEVWKNEMNDMFSEFLAADLHFDNEANKEEIAKHVKEFYFKDKKVSEDTILAFVDYFSDINFGYPTLKSVRMHVESGHKEIYLYEYSFVDNSTAIVPHTDVRGASHCAQSIAVLDGVSLWSDDNGEQFLSDEFKKMKSTIRELWHNFVVHGKPVPEGSSFPPWPAADADGSPHMSIGSVLQLQGPLLKSRIKFWDDIYKKYNRVPMPPPMLLHTEL